MVFVSGQGECCCCSLASTGKTEESRQPCTAHLATINTPLRFFLESSVCRKGKWFLLEACEVCPKQNAYLSEENMLLPQNAEPRVIFGLMTFGPEEATREARITPLDEYNRWLDYFQQQGYNEVDSAGMYVGGRQEAWSREARWKERGLTMATKCYPRAPISHKPAVIREQLETSLKELGTECVDIFYLHAADRAVPSEETLEAVNQFHKEGKFVQLGLSNFTAFEVAEVIITCKANGWVRPSIYQGMYNAISKSRFPQPSVLS